MIITLENAYLPRYAILPRVEWNQLDIQARVLQRARTLFLPGDGDNAGYVAQSLSETRYRIWKPGGNGNEYVIDLAVSVQTCSCAFFTGLVPTKWRNDYTVCREGRRVWVEDRDGNVVAPQETANGWCKHLWGGLLMWEAFGYLPAPKLELVAA